MEADARRAGELRAQQEEVSSGLNTLREESAGLEGRVTGLKRELRRRSASSMTHEPRMLEPSNNVNELLATRREWEIKCCRGR